MRKRITVKIQTPEEVYKEVLKNESLWYYRSTKRSHKRCSGKNVHEYQEFDIHPEVLLKRLNSYLIENHTPGKEELWKRLTRKDKWNE